MAKNTRKSAPAAAYTTGDRVAVKTAATGNEPLPGTVEATTQTGWIVVRLDDPLNHPTCKDGKVSARASSLAPLAPAPEQPKPSDLPLDAPPTDGDPEAPLPKGQSKMAQALQNARKHYAKTRRPDGSKSADNGDAIARELRDLEPIEVASLADKILGLPQGTHRAKYGHLNPGQIRMNSGNRIRAYWKQINEDVDENAIHRASLLLNLIDDEEPAPEDEK